MQGQFSKNTYEGKGTFRWADGATYTGDWVDGRSARLSLGKRAWRLVGAYQITQLFFFCVCVCSCRACCTCFRMHGIGEYRDADGTVWQGHFYNGTGPELVKLL